MRYMLLIYSDEKSWDQAEWTQCTRDSWAICQELAAKGQFLDASPLQPVASAATVRVREGKPLLTDGPFAETTEQLGGYYLIDVDNLDEAIAIASRLPPAAKGTVEIRPVFTIDGLPLERLGARMALVNDKLSAFLFLCYDDEHYWMQAGQEFHLAAMREAVALTHELNAQGHYLSASPLHPSSTATSVRIRNGQRSITDGPFAETREVLGGYYLVLATNRDEALAIAARHPGATVGAVEVRPVFMLGDN